jgi:hypothetical protein
MQVSAELARLCPAASDIANVTAEMTVPERITQYQTVKQLYVTTRIIVVDLLTERLPLQQIAGLLILNAHRVTEQSGEGFAVRLLREGNKDAFVRGLSDAPGQLSQGLSSLERSMRALHVREVFLWPRFRSEVQESLVDVHVCCPFAALATAKQYTSFFHKTHEVLSKADLNDGACKLAGGVLGPGLAGPVLCKDGKASSADCGSHPLIELSLALADLLKRHSFSSNQ